MLLALFLILSVRVAVLVHQLHFLFPHPFQTAGFNPRDLDVVREAMNAVVNGDRGTARRWRSSKDEPSVGGKTGSAQVKRITMAQRAAGNTNQHQEEMPWRDRDHALFIVFAPVEAPRYAVAVVVEHGSHGSSTAAPVAADVLLEALRVAPAPSGPLSDAADPPKRQG